MKLYFYNKYDGDPLYIFLPQNGFNRSERGLYGLLVKFVFFAILVRKSGRRGTHLDRLVFFANLLILIDIDP